MLVHHPSRLIFVHVPATAGLSITRYLLHNRACYVGFNGDLSMAPNGELSLRRRGYSIDSPSDDKETLADSQWSRFAVLDPKLVYRTASDIPSEYTDYENFCVVRDPLTRIASAWAYRVRKKTRTATQQDFIDFVNFVKLLSNQFNEKKIQPKVKLYLPQTHWVREDTRIIKFENLHFDLNDLLIDRGMPEFNKHFNNNQEVKDLLGITSWYELYDEYTTQTVREIYKEDCELWGY